MSDNDYDTDTPENEICCICGIGMIDDDDKYDQYCDRRELCDCGGSHYVGCDLCLQRKDAEQNEKMIKRLLKRITELEKLVETLQKE